MNTRRKNQRQLFSPGRTLATPGAIEELHPEDMAVAFIRHLTGDWGDCCDEDWLRNDEGLDDGARLFSVYHDRNGTKFWIITEADRSVTTTLLPSEY